MDILEVKPQTVTKKLKWRLTYGLNFRVRHELSVAVIPNGVAVTP